MKCRAEQPAARQVMQYSGAHIASGGKHESASAQDLKPALTQMAPAAVTLTTRHAGNSNWGQPSQHTRAWRFSSPHRGQARTGKPDFAATSSQAKSLEENGAQKRTRTSTTLRSPAPEAGASTNSAIWARGRSGRLAAGRRACQPRRPAPRQILFQRRGFVAFARPAPPFALAPSGASRHGDARDAAASGFENRQDRQG